MEKTIHSCGVFLFKKNVFIIILFVIISFASFSQSGAKWATGGNGTSTGDFLGTTNSQPIVFKTNNTQRMQLGTTGVLQINNLSGSGNRFLQTDASGNIAPFAMGTSSQVLYGNGTWGALPTIPASLWVGAGYNIYYPGFVGIGNSSPAYNLDVTGDVRISNNLYVGGGIIISDKVNATTRVTTKTIAADSIIMDSTKAVYGKATFTNNVQLKEKLGVDGDVQVNGSAVINNVLTTHSINTTNLAISGNLATNNLSAHNISFAPGDSTIKLGDSSIYYATYNRFYPDFFAWTSSTAVRGIGIGNPNTYGYGEYSIAMGKGARSFGIASLAFGDQVRANADHSIVIGRGDPAGGALINSTANSLAVGFNSTVPTLFVSPALATGETGNVGISTSTPEDKLQVGSGAYKLVIGSAFGTNIGFGESYIGFNASRQGLSTWSTGNDGSHNGGSIVYSNVSGDLFFSAIPSTGTTNQTSIADAVVKNNIRMVIQANGNVGIGTDLSSNTDGYKLAVNGGIRAKYIKVNASWADYVFAKNYNLISINELEEFIKINKHLPDMPTSNDIETKGADVGELLKLQQQKIEELTLYIIELNKKIETQKAK